MKMPFCVAAMLLAGCVTFSNAASAETIVVSGVTISVAPTPGKIDGRTPPKQVASPDVQKKKKDPAPKSVVAGSKNSGRSELASGGYEPLPGIFRLFQKPQAQPAPVADERDAEVAAAAIDEKKNSLNDLSPRKVAFSGYKPGTIVVNTQTRELFYVESRRTATRYRVAVGKEGLDFKGEATVGDKQHWPKWFPTKDMQRREPDKYAQYAEGMDGGPQNPLGARAIYLYQGKNDTHIRIHGTNNPGSIGTASSNGCFRMINAHVMDLYEKVDMGAPVIVL